MKRIALVYHSAHGHTEHIARHVASGAGAVAGTEVDVLKAEEVTHAPEALVAYDGLVLGSPTYLGGVSGPFKIFMDSTGAMWRSQRLHGKMAAGFTVSSLPAGDKQSTLMSMWVFSMQHGMIWVGNPFLPEQQRGVAYEQAVNRLGSWSGLMAEAGHSAAADAFAAGDIRTAQAFGRNFAAAVHRMRSRSPVARQLEASR